MRPRGTLCILVVSFLLVAAQAPQPDVLPGPVAAALASVVRVRVHETVAVPVFHSGRFRMESVEGLGAGSGVVVAPTLILTNAHVVAGSQQVRVGVVGAGELPATVVSMDEASDLALLRIETGRLQPLDFAPGGIPAVGGPAAPGTPSFVIGNRGDEGPEIAGATPGPRARLRAGARPLEFWSEVAAPIGPGSSGGALLDRDGRLLGVPSLLVTYAPDSPRARSGASGLYIPAAHAARSLRRMMASPRVVWPWIGVLLEDSLMTASEGGVWDPRLDLVVRNVAPASPAQAAGFQQGDRITEIAGRAVRDHFEALDTVLDHLPGEAIAVAIQRGGGTLILNVELGPRPADPRPAPTDDFTLHTGLKLHAAPSSPGERVALAFAGMSPRTRRTMATFEAEMFDERPTLGAILPGQDLLARHARRVPAALETDLAAVMARCFVQEQFVALVHWEFPGRTTLDRAHVHRKIYPVAL